MPTKRNNRATDKSFAACDNDYWSYRPAKVDKDLVRRYLRRHGGTKAQALHECIVGYLEGEFGRKKDNHATDPS